MIYNSVDISMTNDEIQPVEGSHINGPKCGEKISATKRCGGKEWFLKGDKVTCTKNNHTREIPGLKGFLLDGPTCGEKISATKRCGGTDWFVGEDVLICAKLGHNRDF